MTFSLLALTIFVASIQVSPAPTPAPSLPPEIIHTITSESCTTLQKLMLPVGYASKSTDEAFTSMSAQVKAYNDHFLVGEDPNIERPTTNGGTQTGVTGKSVPPGDPSTGSSVGMQMDEGRQDDSETYSPQQTIEASKIESMAQRIRQTITQERKLLNDSYAEYPTGANQQLDAQRTQTSNMIAAQSALADRYENFATTYLTNIAQAQTMTNTVHDSVQYKENLRALLLGATVGLTADPSKAAANNYGFHDIKELSKNGSTVQVVGALRYQERQFASSVYDQYNQCHGTHLVTPAASVSPQ